MEKRNLIQKLSDKEQALIKGGGHWDPELGYITDEVTVYPEYVDVGYNESNWSDFIDYLWFDPLILWR